MRACSRFSFLLAMVEEKRPCVTLLAFGAGLFLHSAAQVLEHALLQQLM